jgi:AGCS family alanine or glycine:cation symporter
MNGLMALPNLIGLLVLSGLVARETKKYLDNDPKLTATTEEVNAFMAGDASFDDWKTQAIPVVGKGR